MHTIHEVKNMKKYVINLGVIMLSLLILSIEPTYGQVEEKTRPLNINNTELLNYIQDHHLTNIKAICTYDFCDYVRSENMNRAMEIFTQKYKENLASQKGEEAAISATIKGFPITEIKLF